MSRKSAYVIFSIVLVFLILVLTFFFFLYERNSTGQYNLNGSLSNSIRDFLPFGKNAPLQNLSNLNQQITTQTNEATTSEIIVPALRQISTAPVAGAELIDSTSTVIQDMVKKTSTNQTIRFVDRSTGHIFDTKKDNMSVEEISNTTIPKVYESFFSSNPDIAIFRSLDEGSDTIVSKEAYLAKPTNSTTTDSTQATTTATSSIVAPIIYSGTPYVTKTSILPTDIESMAVAPSSQRFLYMFSDASGGTFVLSNLDGTKPVKLYSSPLGQWLVDWPNEKGAVITTKSSGIANGISLLVDTTTGVLSKIASGNGLTTLVSPDLSQALVGTSGDGSVPYLNVVTLKNNSTINLSFRTLPEKCVWSHTEKSTVYCAVPENIPVGTYPDSWYQGLVSFTDNLWKINTSTGVSNIAALFTKGYGKNFDAINLQLSSDDTYLIFTNKSDLILWGYNLKYQLGGSAGVTTGAPTTSSSTTSS